MTKLIDQKIVKVSTGLHGEGVFLAADVFDNGDKENNIFVTLKIQTECHGQHQTQITMTEVSLDSLADGIAILKNELNLK